MVDVARREVVARIDAVADPLALALSDDGATLFVASHRSGQPDRGPYPADPLEQEHDIAIIDLIARTRTGTVLDAGATLDGLLFAGGQLWLTATSADTTASLADPLEPSSRHEAVALAPEAGLAQRAAAVDLTRGPGSV